MGGQEAQDAAGNKMAVLPSGERMYLNRPGLGAQDLQAVATQAGAYAPAALAAAPLALTGRVLTTGALSGATNAGLQTLAGRDEIDPTEVLTTAAIGGASEAIAPAVQAVFKHVREGLRTTGSNTRAAVEMAKKAGIEAPTNGQINGLARALDEIKNGADP